jgi:hypothetical protein
MDILDFWHGKIRARKRPKNVNLFKEKKVGEWKTEGARERNGKKDTKIFCQIHACLFFLPLFEEALVDLQLREKRKLIFLRGKCLK